MAEVTLRDGRAITLRAMVSADLPGMHALDHAVVRDGHGVGRGVDELPALEAFVEQGKKLLARCAAQANAAWIAAVAGDGSLLGEGSLRGVPMSYCAHVSAFALSVHPCAQGVGLGRAIGDHLMAFARCAQPRVERVGLYVRADNHRAIALYESLGFEHEGVRRKFMRLPDGTYVDDLVMGLLL